MNRLFPWILLMALGLSGCAGPNGTRDSGGGPPLTYSALYIAAWFPAYDTESYDYHWSTFHAGPIAPIDWLGDILDYCRSVPTARGKLIVGLPLYGLDWGTVLPADEVMFADAKRLSAVNSVFNVNRDSVEHTGNTICGVYRQNVEPHFQYALSGACHTVYYQDSQSLKSRLELINQYRDVIRGVTFWRLGGEDPFIWNELSKYK